MKTSFIALAAVVSMVNATVMFQDPWAGSKSWKSGQNAHIKWTSDPADADKLCDIQMLNGDTKNSNIVATVTNPTNPVKCGVNEFEIKPLNDFKTGKYWLRIGQATTNNWIYSGVFNFEGTGSATPLKLADGTTDYPTAEAPNNDKKDKKNNNNNNNNNHSNVSSKPSESAKANASMTSANSDTPRVTSLGDRHTPTADTTPKNVPNVKKESKQTDNDKKSNDAAYQQSGFTVMGLAGMAAFALSV